MFERYSRDFEFFINRSEIFFTRYLQKDLVDDDYNLFLLDTSTLHQRIFLIPVLLMSTCTKSPILPSIAQH